MFKINNKGFSLVELMIVVAIIGILASVAVPNFQKFMAKSKQSEAKSNLSALFAAEKSFFAEWNMYFGDFKDVGFNPEGALRYSIGFSANAGTLPPNYPLVAGATTSAGAGNAAVDVNSLLYCALGATVSCTNVLKAAGGYAAPAVTGDGCAVLATMSPLGVTLTTFTAAAAGDIDGDASFDSWAIDDSKTLINCNPDMRD